MGIIITQELSPLKIPFLTLCGVFNKIVCTGFWFTALWYTGITIEALAHKYVQYQSIFLTKHVTTGKYSSMSRVLQAGK